MDTQDKAIEEIEQYLAKLSPEARAAKKHQMREIMRRADAELIEVEKERKRGVVATREAACRALINAVVALRPLLVEIDRTSDAVRHVVPLLNPAGVDFALCREVAGLNVQGALDSIEATRAIVYAEIERAAA